MIPRKKRIAMKTFVLLCVPVLSMHGNEVIKHVTTKQSIIIISVVISIKPEGLDDILIVRFR